MARPSASLRLRDLVPEEVARAVVDLVQDHIGRLAFVLAPGIVWEMSAACSGEPLSSTLGWTVIQLTRYAHTGERGDWENDGMVSDAIQEVCSALYSCAGEPGTFGVGEIERAAEDLDAIAIVLVAASTRLRLRLRGATAIAVRDLAVLASVAPNHVRLLGRSGELVIEDGMIARAEAKRWLSSRGVP